MLERYMQLSSMTKIETTNWPEVKIRTKKELKQDLRKYLANLGL